MASKTNTDAFVKSKKTVTPAKAGVQNYLNSLDSRFHGNDDNEPNRTFYETINTILKKQSGAALVVALIMMVVITLIALASSYTSIFEIGISGNKRGKTNAFFVADGCINELASSPATFDQDGDFVVLVPNTTAIYNNPPTSCGSGSITAFLNQSGAPRGGGWGTGSSYSYFRIDCTGNDRAGSAATAQMQENVMRLLPVE